ncbi:hypothetical protein ACMYR3_09310 [Ampullimonas aquatilis]|uniref:hypothetical protein n=1 Tax=Ampullimonas aquatilis TaxID=1341549 RepID=UPI003C746482
MSIADIRAFLPLFQTKGTIMTVAQLIIALQSMPANAVVLFQGDTGYDLVAGLEFQKNEQGLPDEVILFPDMTPD